MVLTWGPEFLQFYNDAYAPLIGAKHPAIGEDIRVTLAEGWDALGPADRRTRWRPWRRPGCPGLLLLLERAGYREETYFTVSHAPAFGDDGRVGRDARGLHRGDRRRSSANAGSGCCTTWPAAGGQLERRARDVRGDVPRARRATPLDVPVRRRLPLGPRRRPRLRRRRRGGLRRRDAAAGRLAGADGRRACRRASTGSA